MTGGIARRRVSPSPFRRRPSLAGLEGLEDRLLLYATTGVLWSMPAVITYSLIPDGTSIGGVASNLNQTLSAKAGWQQQIQKAAAAWEAVAGINFAQVSDSGAPIGTTGNQQDDPRFGDIRIGGMAQASGQLAFAYAPPPFNGGTNAGDIFFNTAQSWQTNGTAYDLMTVAIHEFGHALGMNHSTIVKACMYAAYGGSKQALNSDDISGIQSIYSTRQADPLEGSGGNNTSKTASVITSYLNSTGLATLPGLDITTAADVDWFKVTAPASTTGAMTVAVQSSQLSLLTPALTVYDANLKSLGSATGTTFGATLTVTAQGVKSGQVYYIKASAATSGTNGVGAYGLQVNFGSSGLVPIPPPDTTVASQPDLKPTTCPQGVGWLINGHFVPYAGDKGNAPTDPPGLGLIHSGTLAGYGDALTIANLEAPAHLQVAAATEPDRGAPVNQARLAPDATAVPPPAPSGRVASTTGDPGSDRRPSTRRSGTDLPAAAARLRAVDAALTVVPGHRHFLRLTDPPDTLFG
jgi:hypothetical protein